MSRSLPHPDHAQDPSPVDEQLPALGDGAGVENDHVFAQAGVETADLGALFGGGGISGSGEHHVDSGVVGPGRRSSLQDVEKIAAQTRKHRLGLGVAKSHVELEDLGPLLSEHHSGVEKAGEAVSVVGHLSECGSDHLVHNPVDQAVGEVADRGVGTHSPGVGSFVSLEETLVVAGRLEGHRPAIGADGEHAHLGAVEELLHHNRSGVHPVVDPRLGIGAGVGHQNPLSAGEPVGLHHVGTLPAIDVGSGHHRVLEGLRAAGGDTGSCHYFFGERLRRLQTRRGTGGSEHRDSEPGDRVGHPGGERCLGTYDHQVDTVQPRYRRDRSYVGDIDAFHRGPQLAKSGIARERDQLVDPGRLGQLPADGVLSASGADQEHSHEISISCDRSGPTDTQPMGASTASCMYSM
jgi:hypothetical protein